MFMVFIVLFSVVHANINTDLDKIQYYIMSLYNDRQITSEQKEECEKNINLLRNTINNADQAKLTKKNGYELYIENVIGYIPIALLDAEISEKEYRIIYQSGIKLMSQGKMDMAYRKFARLSNAKVHNHYLHYYWMGMIRLKQKKFDDAILHLGQFYKSVTRSKLKKNEDKLPRSLLNIMECLLNLCKTAQAKLIMEFFDSKYPDYRKSVHEKYVIDEIKKAENLL